MAAALRAGGVGRPCPVPVQLYGGHHFIAEQRTFHPILPRSLHRHLRTPPPSSTPFHPYNCQIQSEHYQNGFWRENFKVPARHRLFVLSSASRRPTLAARAVAANAATAAVSRPLCHPPGLLPTGHTGCATASRADMPPATPTAPAVAEVQPPPSEMPQTAREKLPSDEDEILQLDNHVRRGAEL